MEEFDERLLSARTISAEDDTERSLRPHRLTEYVGQENVKELLKVYIEAAKQRGDALDHVLLYGPPGLGKTTLANIIAAEMGVSIRITSGPALEKTGDIVALLTNLQEGDILFIDEIHRLSRTVEEVLYPAMEDFEFDIIIGKGPSARSIRFDLPKFTLIGATTRSGQLTSPFRDRFGVLFRLELYTVGELARIVTRSADILGIKIDPEGAEEIASRSRGTPRIANRLLKRVRDFAQIMGDGTITKSIARQALLKLNIDEIGLDNTDRNMLEAMIRSFNGGPVGLGNIAVSVGEEQDTIEDVYEPYLIQEGYMMRTAQGRLATEKSWSLFGLTPRGRRGRGSGADVPDLF